MEIIIPYEGTETIKFGMTSTEVVSALGQPLHVTVSRLGDTELRYAEVVVEVSKRSGRVEEIEFTEDSKAMIAGVDIFGDPEAFVRLLILDGAPMYHAGTVLLLKLGIGLWEFDVKDADNRSVGAFRRGLWDSELHKFVKMALPGN